LALLSALVILYMAARPAHAAPSSAGALNAAAGAGARKHSAPPREQAERGGQLTAPSQLSEGTIAKELGSSGQVDPITGLGIRNPVCDQLAQIRARATRLSCEANGTPESNYPASNYGFDIFVTTGLTHPVGDFTYGFAMVLNGIWLGLIFVLKLVLELLGLAFGLNPFGEGQTMSQISATVGRLYQRITDPWLSTLVVCGGIWFAYKGILKRELAAGVAGTVAAIAMLVAGLWVVNQPRASVGGLAVLSNEVALGTISAPQSGSVSRPLGSYAESMAATWSRLVEVPFAGLDFSDLQWALGPPPPEAVRKADEKFCDDYGALALLAVLSNLGSAQAKQACAGFAAKRYGRPTRVIDLYLRSSPGSPARQALWSYFNADPAYKAKVAAQGGGGVLTRLSMLALFALGLLGAILLLAWLAIRLFTQAAIAFVLLLAAPFALFFPLLGDAGRRGFRSWGMTLLGALCAKVIYAAFLSIVVLGISILGRFNGPAGSASGFLLSCAFSWAVLLKRAELISWISIGEAERAAARGFGLAQLTALRIGGRVVGAPGASVGGVLSRAHYLMCSHAEIRAEVTRETARGHLQNSARALADQRYGEARATVSGAEAAPSATGEAGSGAVGSKRTPRGAAITRTPGPRQPAAARAETRAGPSAELYQRARQLLAHVERNQVEIGERWSETDMRRFEAEDRELLRSSRNPADHAHRAGYQRSQLEALHGLERELAEQQIERERKRDSHRLAVASQLPGRIVGRPRQGAERIRQGLEELGEFGLSTRLEHLRRLRRSRRSAALSSRRNLSRGG